ncbi:MAG: hypothetical protein LBU58_03665, partial [Clostridiales bacterium]|nr:hypothetical protein [Clostridiales bacterium]
RQAEVKSTVAADGKHLSRVLENLLGNAAKYALPGTRVYAEITEQDGGTGTGAGPGIGDGSGAGTVSLSIKNVSAAPLEVSPEMLTERFVRGERSRNTEGSGLGLYIAKYLLEGMGGSLTIGISGDLFDAAVKLPRARFCEKTPKA